MKTPFLLSSLGLIWALGTLSASAQTLTPLTVSGYTQDYVAGPSDPVGSGNGVTYEFAGFVFFAAQGYAGWTPNTYGLPANGTIVSESNPNAMFQLASYYGNNTLLVGNTGQDGAAFGNNRTLTFAPGNYSEIGILYTDQIANRAESLVLNYSDGTTSSVLDYTTNGQDWAGRDSGNTPQSPPVNAALSGGDWVDAGGHYGGLLEEADFAVDPAKILTGITFSSTGNEFIMGISGDAQVVPEPGTWAMMLGGLGFLMGLRRLKRTSRLAI